MTSTTDIPEIYVILDGCRYEGYSTVYVGTDRALALRAWEKLEKQSPQTDHRFEHWRNNKRKKIQTRNYAGLNNGQW